MAGQSYRRNWSFTIHMSSLSRQSQRIQNYNENYKNKASQASIMQNQFSSAILRR